MVNQILKITAYAGLLFVIVYAIASASGQRALVGRPKPPRRRKAAGSVYAANSVPVPVSSAPPSVYPVLNP